MPRAAQNALRHCIALEHPRWTRDQIAAVVHDAEDGRGPYAVLLADLTTAKEVRLP